MDAVKGSLSFRIFCSYVILNHCYLYQYKNTTITMGYPSWKYLNSGQRYEDCAPHRQHLWPEAVNWSLWLFVNKVASCSSRNKFKLDANDLSLEMKLAGLWINSESIFICCFALLFFLTKNFKEGPEENLSGTPISM